jgi:membrane protease YdiL (CAAX protease family)
VGLLSGFLIGAVLLLVGAIGLLLFLIFALTGKLRSGIVCGSPTGGLYAETFAVWLLLFVGLSLAAARLPLGGDDWAVGRAGLAMLLSLSALAWPVLRGVSWRQVRREVGWTPGRQPLLEPFCGLGCYIMSWPMIAVGMLLTIVLIMVGQSLAAGSGGGGSNWMPTHPATGLAVAGDWWVRLQLLLVAAVVAPIVEETMFRGVLYRHLRETSRRVGQVLSVVFSATVAGFLFAVIHPQGWYGVPVLMAVAYGLVMAREWRGTLIPGMVFHGLHNGLLLVVLILVAGG